MNVSPALQQAAQAAVDRLMRELKGVRAVVIASEDGFELAGRMENSAQVARLSALASSLAALGALAGEESSLGACDNVTIEAAHGHLVMVRARHPEIDLIISVVTSREAIIGQVLYMSKLSARQLGSQG
ncbi:roadblock/LC7 domain-containing protein [Xenophilus sp. Marseille-Q4582]|uniref:roadblock/LC7 domain-containing protein n=1 Tax=Xenophilus sp. Marseille-Q4582 TaxID=2866600 RepID=UPI001CE45982|nr:roadblock/LC7 domain-containing protein [Xenophilus sp. Marseille-Q4582]